MLDNLLKFPGLPWVSDVIGVVIVIAFEVTFYVLFLAVLKFYVSGVTKISRIVGSLIGILVGVFFASGYTRTLGHCFELNDAMTSAVLIGFIVMNLVITSAVYVMSICGGTNGTRP